MKRLEDKLSGSYYTPFRTIEFMMEFLVHPEATKSQIKEAVEKMFTGTKVEKVNTMNNDGKKKRVRGTYSFGKTAKTKKAIVKLTEDSADIEIFQGL